MNRILNLEIRGPTRRGGEAPAGLPEERLREFAAVAFGQGVALADDGEDVEHRFARGLVGVTGVVAYHLEQLGEGVLVAGGSREGAAEGEAGLEVGRVGGEPGAERGL